MVKKTPPAESATAMRVGDTRGVLEPLFIESPTKDAITHLAYALYLVRGCEHGRDVEDWVKAEKELSGKPIGQPQTTRVAHPARPVWFE
jgi:hypothetical protein